MFNRRIFRTSIVVALLVALMSTFGAASAQTADLGGSVTFRDSSALSDSLVISLTGVTAPAAGTLYEGWLVGGGVKLSTGVFTVSSTGTIDHTYVSPTGANLVATYPTFVITSEPDTRSALYIALQAQHSSGQSGWAKLTANGTQTDVSLTLSAGTLQTELVHIHTGQCGDATLGGVAHGLTSFTGGSGNSLKTVNASLASLLTGGFAINAHEKDNAGNYTACGNIPAEADTVTFTLDELASSGQSGWATMTARGAQTEVVLDLSAGTLQTELVHIHTGQCGATLGGVAHNLSSFTGGSGQSVTWVDADYMSLRTGGFAINADEKDNAGNYTACGNIASRPGPAVYSDVIPAGAFLHMGHLLSSWPANPSSKGIVVGLREQVGVARDHAVLADISTTLANVQSHAHHVVNIIEGSAGANYVAAFGDPGDGNGVLNYASDAITHATLAKNEAPDNTTVVAGADGVIATANNVITWATAARDNALTAIAQTTLGPVATFAIDNAVSNLTAALQGRDGDGDGTVESIANEGGAWQAYWSAQDIRLFMPVVGAPPSVGDSLLPELALSILLAGLALAGAGGFLLLRRRTAQA